MLGWTRRILVGGLLVVSTLLPGCNQQDVLEKLTTPQDQAFAKTAIDQLRKKQFKSLEAECDPKMKDAKLRPRSDSVERRNPAG